MRAARALGFAAVVFVAHACANATTALPPPSDPHAQMGALERRIFEIVETERLKLDPNAKTLALDSGLAEAARAHSADMAAKNYLAHKGPDGSTAVDHFLDSDSQFQGILGENLAAQYFVVGYGIDVDALAHRFVESWLASKTHKDNLAFAPYDRTGVGAAVSGNTIYVTELFSAHLGASSADPKKRQVTEFPDPKTAKDAPAPAMTPPE